MSPAESILAGERSEVPLGAVVLNGFFLVGADGLGHVIDWLRAGFCRIWVVSRSHRLRPFYRGGAFLFVNF